MRRVVNIGLTLIALGLCSIGCIDPYTPPVSDDTVDYMVIEGNINSTNNSAIVKISKAIPLAESTDFPKVTGATVFIEKESRAFINLSEVEPGEYSASSTFDHSIKYRLNVSIRGEKYISDFIQLQKVSPIDSLTWQADQDKLEIRVNTHDFTEGVKYYKYNFEETYEYRSAFFSSYKFINGVPIYRTAEEEIHRCWTTAPSTSILVAATENLKQNRISDFEIVQIERGDPRLFYQYSALVRQSAISEGAYQYWNHIRNLTESLGGLFDPIPFQVKGNVYSLDDPDKVVIGYFSGGEVSEKRIVLKIGEYPYDYKIWGQVNCEEYFIPISDLGTLTNYNIILTRAEYIGITIIGYWYSSVPCIDCTTDGGTKVKPDFMY